MTPSNRRVRTRTHGGVGGEEPRGSPLSRLRYGPAGDSALTLRLKPGPPPPPFSLVNSYLLRIGPASGRGREAAKRTLDGKDRSGIIQGEGKGGTAGRESTTGRLHKGTRLCENPPPPPGTAPCLLGIEWDMAHITGTDRAQVLLLPDTVDDYVDPDNPVRFIDAFVDSLDLAGAGFERAEPKETGRPGYDPADLLKLRRSPARRSGRFPKERFRYDAGTDTYACPNGQQLKPLYISRVRDTTLMHYANRGACRGCALKVQCTSNSYRRIGRYVDEAVLDRMAERLADRPGVLHRRRESAEHPFGSIKHWMGHGGFLMRRLENVRGEFSLTALAYNIRRATTLVGIPELIAAWGVQTSWNRPPPRACCNAAGRMASANRRQPTHGPNPRLLTP